MSKSEYDEIKANLIKQSLERNKTDVYVPIERRKGEDGVLKFINLICFLSWTAIFIIFAIIVKAGENISYIKKHGLLWLPVDFWEVGLLRGALIVTIVCWIVCMTSIILNFTRHKRRTDRIKKSLIICEILCFIFGLFLILKLY